MRIAIVSGTVFGAAEEVAWRAGELLTAAGLDTAYRQHWDVTDLLEHDPGGLLFIASTTGMGELPEKMQPLVDTLQERQPDWVGRPVGIIGLGDAGYGDNFCLAADELEDLADLLGLVRLQDTLRLDASETVTPEQDAVPWLQEFAGLLKAWND
ncbi:flavodoxin domain-containing protein [Thiopseudomonas denitrificans]|uniref:MioC protein n=1 Tax=Thiopseudomonas denitrificans TaxID=1501432 RepID=A0A4R6U777_9GAMM|nr:flavodoxin domain-containing protein [Thiopseudomonas denitrificans]TDQ38894.1 MioC protein [Thiopseudomonas denitrificans]